jgi:hypothetical protein
MAWRIDRDYLDGNTDDSRVGTGQGELGSETFRFRLLDDDQNVYYGGVADREAAENDDEEGGLYQANKWGEWNAGAVWLEVRVRDAEAFGLYPGAKELTGKRDSEWISIYA